MPSLKFIIHKIKDHFFIRIKHIWVFLFGIIIAYLIPLFLGLDNSIYVKSSGLILQILFIAVVMRALIKIRNRFMAKDDKLKPFIQHLSEWLMDLNTLFETRSVTVQLESAKVETSMGDINVLTSDKEKIELLRKNQKKLFKRVKSLENKLIDEKSKLKKHIDSLEELIKNLNINSLGFEWVSLYWLAIGLVLRTYPEGIANLF